MLPFEQFVFDGFDEGFPAGFNDVFIHADSRPGFFLILEFDKNTNLGCRAGLGINNTHFIIGEMNLIDLRIKFT